MAGTSPAMTWRKLPRLEDRFGGVADGFHRHVRVEEAHDPARAAFEAFIAPREGADQAALAEHEIDVPAEIFRMQQAFLERPIVERENVGRDFAARQFVR